jgi:hypothetical protein
MLAFLTKLLAATPNLKVNVMKVSIFVAILSGAGFQHALVLSDAPVTLNMNAAYPEGDSLLLPARLGSHRPVPPSKALAFKNHAFVKSQNLMRYSQIAQKFTDGHPLVVVC